MTAQGRRPANSSARRNEDVDGWGDVVAAIAAESVTGDAMEWEREPTGGGCYSLTGRLDRLMIMITITEDAWIPEDPDRTETYCVGLYEGFQETWETFDGGTRTDWCWDVDSDWRVTTVDGIPDAVRELVG